MNVAELAAQHRAAKLAQLARLRPKIAETRQAVDMIRTAKANQGQARQAVELMQKLRYVPGFFPTPRALVQRMIAEAGNVAGKTVLEPSAGKGNIADALREANANLLCVEYNGALVRLLREKRHECVEADFLECSGFPGHAGPDGFAFVLMNPPFERGADLKHIQHAFGFLKPGGKLVAIASSTAGAKLEDWAQERAGYVEQLPPGSFATSERPTGVNTCLIICQKN